MQKDRWITPPEYAEARGIKPDKVLTWIRSGVLKAVNFAASTKGRPRWRISPEAVQEFEQGRTSVGKVEAVPVRRKSRSGVVTDVIEFY